MTKNDKAAAASVLIVDSEIIVRHALADYLRHCGYAVVEAADTDEAVLAISEAALSVDIVLCHVGANGSRSGFELATWVRQNRSDLEVKLAGSIERAAKAAADLCEAGPQLARPYEPEGVVEYIKQLRATRERNTVSLGS